MEDRDKIVSLLNEFDSTVNNFADRYTDFIKAVSQCQSDPTLEPKYLRPIARAISKYEKANGITYPAVLKENDEEDAYTQRKVVLENRLTGLRRYIQRTDILMDKLIPESPELRKCWEVLISIHAANELSNPGLEV